MWGSVDSGPVGGADLMIGGGGRGLTERRMDEQNGCSVSLHEGFQRCQEAILGNFGGNP